MAEKKVYGMGRIKQLMKLPSAKPMYVLNIINYKNFSAYRWYGLGVLPALKLVRANVEWAGHPTEMLYGQAQCQSLLIVRYPSHQSFIRMIANPYYAAINKLREKGVASFEGAFSEALSGNGKALHKQPQVLALHLNADNPAVAITKIESALEQQGAKPLLSISQYLALDLLPRPKPTDPNPLRYQQNLFFAFDELNNELKTTVSVLLAELSTDAGDGLAAIYTRSKEKSFLPGQPVPDYLS